MDWNSRLPSRCKRDFNEFHCLLCIHFKTRIPTHWTQTSINFTPVWKLLCRWKCDRFESTFVILSWGNRKVPTKNKSNPNTSSTAALFERVLNDIFARWSSATHSSIISLPSSSFINSKLILKRILSCLMKRFANGWNCHGGWKTWKIISWSPTSSLIYGKQSSPSQPHWEVLHPKSQWPLS